MIIKALGSLIYGVLSVLLVFDLPSLPDTVTAIAESVKGYISTGIGVLGAFVGREAMGVLSVLLGLVVALNAAYALYSLVFWVIRKIPMLSVKE